MRLQASQFPLVGFQQWLVNRHAAVSTITAYVGRVRTILSLLQPEETAEGYAAITEPQVLAAIEDGTAAMQSLSRTAWNAYASYLFASFEITVPTLLSERRRAVARANQSGEESFASWLTGNGAALGTAVLYTSRMAAVRKALALPDAAAEQGPYLTPAAYTAYVDGMTPAMAASVRTAWNAYCTYLKARGVQVEPVPSEPRRREVEEKRLAVPAQIASALWTILREHQSRPGFVPLLHALRWTDLRWHGAQSPRDAFAVTFRDMARPAGGEVRYTTPLTAWTVLWDWRRGDAERPSGPVAGIELDELHQIVSFGRRDRIPLLRVDGMGVSFPQVGGG